MVKTINWRYRNHETAKFEFKEKKDPGEKYDKINSKDMSDNKESD